MTRRKATPSRATSREDALPAPRSSRASVFRFVIIFAVVMGAYYAVSAIPFYRDTLFPRYLEWNALASTKVLNLLGQSAIANGEDIRDGSTAVSIKKGCDAIAPTMLFTAAVIAFPAPWRRRLIGIAIGAPVLLGINLIRIITLFYARKYASNETFDMLHVDIWQPLFILIALLMWLFWALRATPRPPPAGAAI